MIPALLMILCISASTTESIFRKMFANRFGGKGTFLFNAFVTAAAGLFFAFTSGGLQWEPGILPYVLLFSFCYATTSATYTLALSCGPLSLSTLIYSFSTILPTLYGLLLGESIRVSTFLPGLALLLISLFFTNKPQKNEKSPSVGSFSLQSPQSQMAAAPFSKPCSRWHSMNNIKMN